MYFGAKPYSPADVIDGSQLTLEDIERDVVVGYSLPYPCLQEPLQGMRLYEHTVITSSAGSGKSSLITAIAHHMSREHGWMVGNIFLEEKSVKSQQPLDAGSSPTDKPISRCACAYRVNESINNNTFEFLSLK